ncbi:MAG TPA: DUF3276 family protein [Candidatus Lokiarchaeia archaeon]|nr:DUF3276 family protein [Candidatus Lokiarchaeia archaeon]
MEIRPKPAGLTYFENVRSIAIILLQGSLARFWNGKNLAIAEDRDAVALEFPSDVTPAQDAGDVLSQIVRAGTRTYFIDVKAAKTSEKYMTITGSEGKGMEKRRVMVFAEYVDEFVNAVEKARDALNQ